MTTTQAILAAFREFCHTLLAGLRATLDALVANPIPTPTVSLTFVGFTNMATATYRWGISTGSSAIHHYNSTIDGITQPQQDVLDGGTIDFNQGANITAQTMTDDIGGVLSNAVAMPDLLVPTAGGGTPDPVVTLTFVQFNP